MKIIIITLFSLFLVMSFIPFTQFVFAQANPSGDKPVQLTNPLGNDADATNPNIIIGKVIEMVLSIVGSLALLMFIYGGFTWMLAAGNNERVQKGKEILIWATIGLIVIFSAYAMVKLIFQGLGIQ